MPSPPRSEAEFGSVSAGLQDQQESAESSLCASPGRAHTRLPLVLQGQPLLQHRHFVLNFS